jgi:hypothetical protein
MAIRRIQNLYRATRVEVKKEMVFDKQQLTHYLYGATLISTIIFCLFNK